MTDHLRVNRNGWNSLARAGHRHARIVTDDELKEPLKTIDPRGWLGPVAGKRLLCLAAGGGWQSALYAAAGAIVTVVDLSPAMLELDRKVADERGFAMELVETSMDDLSPLAEASFDVVVQPVSTCYVPDVVAVYREVGRVTRPGGLYVSQHKQPASMQSSSRPQGGRYKVVLPYHHEGPLPRVDDSAHREPGTVEYLHRWDALIGGLCRSGFVVEDLAEPYHGGEGQPRAGSFAERSRYLPPYVRMKARRVGTGSTEATSPLWVPGR